VLWLLIGSLISKVNPSQPILIVPFLITIAISIFSRGARQINLGSSYFEKHINIKITLRNTRKPFGIQ
jgi:hypothetical protein